MVFYGQGSRLHKKGGCIMHSMGNVMDLLNHFIFEDGKALKCFIRLKNPDKFSSSHSMARSTRRKPTTEGTAASPSSSRRVTRSQAKAMKQQQQQQQPKDAPTETLPPLTAAEWKKLNPKTEHYE